MEQSPEFNIDAWKIFVASGFISSLPSEVSKKLYKVHKSIGNINFFANVSIKLFSILASQNRLEPTMNEMLDINCKISVVSFECALLKDFEDAIREVKRLL